MQFWLTLVLDELEPVLMSQELQFFAFSTNAYWCRKKRKNCSKKEQNKRTQEKDNGKGYVRKATNQSETS